MQRDQTAVTYLHTLIRTLTAGVYESVDGVGQEADTAQKTGALLFVNLLVVPHTDGDGVCFSDISGRGRYQDTKVRTQKTARWHWLIAQIKTLLESQRSTKNTINSQLYDIWLWRCRQWQTKPINCGLCCNRVNMAEISRVLRYCGKENKNAQSKLQCGRQYWSLHDPMYWRLQ